VRRQRHSPAALYPQEKRGTHCTGGWVGPRAGLDRCGESRPHRDSIPGSSSPWAVAISTELSRLKEDIMCWYLYFIFCPRSPKRWTASCADPFYGISRKWDNKYEHCKFKFFYEATAPPPVGLLINEISRSHTTTHHIRWDSSGRVIGSSQRTLPDNTQHSQQTNIHATVGFEPMISAGEQPQTNALNRAATGTGRWKDVLDINAWKTYHKICMYKLSSWWLTHDVQNM
jgi:hypothetical protein